MNHLDDNKETKHFSPKFDSVMKRIIQSFLYISLILSIGSSNFAFAIDHIFPSYSIEQGLSDLNITDVEQDQQGFIWIATTDGLNRFDGHNFIVFRSDPDDLNSLSSNSINGLVVDRENNLWILTSAGLDRFERSTGKFIHYSKAPYDQDFFKNNPAWFIKQGHGQTLLIVGSAGILVFNKQTEQYQLLDTFNEVNDVDIASDEQLLIVTSNGLFQYQPQQQITTQLMLPTKAENAPQPRIYCISNEVKRIRFYCSRAGLFYSFDDSYYFISNEMLALPAPASQLAIADNNELWITTFDGTYVKQIDPRALSKSVRQNKLLRLSKQKASNIFIDNSNVAWIGTATSGLIKIAPQARNFALLPIKNGVTKATLTTTNNAILGTSKGEVLLFDDDYNHIDSINLKDNHGNVIKSKINDIALTDDNTLLIASPRGLTQVNLKTKAQDTREILDSRFAQNNYPTRIIQLSNRTLVTARLSGLGEFDTSHSRLKPITPTNWPPNKIFAPTIYAILLIDSDLWLAGGTGDLYRYDLKNNLGYVYPILDHDNAKLGISDILGLALDQSNTLWLAGLGGLMTFNIDSEKMRYQHAILPQLNLSYRSVSVDKKGIIWATNQDKLIRIDPNNPAKRYYDLQSSMPIKNFLTATQTTNTNTLLFGGINGLLSFNPNLFDNPEKSPKISLSSIEINRPDQNNSEAMKWMHIFHNPQDQLILDKTDNNIRLGFAVLDFSSNSNLFYRYKLINYDTNWHIAEPSRQKAVYNKLPKGTYQFAVSLSTDGHHWFPQQTIATIQIKPSGYETLWAQAFYVISILLTLKLLHSWRVRRLKRQAVALNATIAERTAEINTLLEQRTRFFTFVSHELKTPLTLIRDPLERLAKTTNSKDAELLNIARRNSQKIETMIERLLDASTSHHKAPRYSITIKSKIDNAVRQLSEFALEHSVSLIKQSIEDCTITATEDEIDIILFNLLSNAIKYNRTDGQVNIQCSKIDNQCVLTISDQGQGFESEQNKTDIVDKNHYGLTLVKQVLLSLDGKLNINSNQNGSQVSVTLPLAHKPKSEQVTIIKDTNSELENKQLPIVFFVEDNEELRNYVADLFSKHYQCLKFANGEDALGQAIETIPDIIISDIQLPKMNGIDLCRQIRENQQTCHIPIILLTGSSDSQTQLASFQNLANDLMTKPFNGEALILKVANLLKLIAQIRQTNQQVQIDQGYNENNSSGLAEKDKLFIQRFVDILALNYTDTSYNLECLCKDMFMSKTQLSRKLQAICNKSPIEYLKEYRLERAKVLLADGGQLGSVAMETGFSSQSYFSTCFKVYFGTTPKKYQLEIIAQRRTNQ